MTAESQTPAARMAFENGGRLSLGRVLSTGTRACRLRANGEVVKVPRSRLWLAVLDNEAGGGRESSALLKEAELTAAAIDEEQLWRRAWQLRQGAPGGGILAHDLARAHFGDDASAAQRLAALSACLARPAEFRRTAINDGRGGLWAGFVPVDENTRARVQKAQAARRARDDAEERLAAALAAGETPPEISRDAAQLLTAPDKASAAYRALRRHAGGGDGFARHLLRAGVLKSAREYHDVKFRRAWGGLRCARLGPPAAFENSPPPPSAPLSLAYSIDDEGTVEFDDAFSVSPLDDGGDFRIGVHIAAPALGVLPPSVDALEKLRLISVYFPHKKHPMLTPAVRARFSLSAGAVRPALSFYFNFSPATGAVVKEGAKLDWVKVEANLSPSACDSGDAPKAFLEIYPILQQAAASLNNTASRADDRDFKIRAPKNSQDGGAQVLRRRRGAADKMVEAMMRLVNAEWGGALAQGGAGIFQKDGMPHARAPRDKNEAYAWASSPLRRFVDLINQHILLHFLGMAKSDSGAAQSAAAATAAFRAQKIRAAAHQAAMERYWALCALQQSAAAGQSAAAVMIDARRCRLEYYPLVGAAAGCGGLQKGARFQARLLEADLISLTAKFARAPDAAA